MLLYYITESQINKSYIRLSIIIIDCQRVSIVYFRISNSNIIWCTRISVKMSVRLTTQFRHHMTINHILKKYVIAFV